MPSRSDKPDPAALFECQRELIALSDTLTEVIFCVKDTEGVYVEVNAAFVRRTGAFSKRQVIGSRATDHFGPELAERYEEQDRRVIETGRALRDQLELIQQSTGAHGWYLTTKLPVFDDDGTVVGLVSVSRDLKTPSEESVALDGLQTVVDHVRGHLSEPLRVADLAAIAGCSPAQLERRMRKVFGVTATQYVLRVRVEAARRLLVETDEPLAIIAGRCGFYDQSAFTRRFARLTNATPAQFRARHLR
jgi:PAS domain S-box-containing protein